MTWAYAINYCGLIIANFCNPIAMKALGWKYYIFFCVLLAISIVLIWFLFPETRGRTLEEVAEIFEGKDGAGGVGSCLLYTSPSPRD